MILTFSGTGNSRYAARILSEVTGDEIVDLKNRIKNGDASPITAERLILAVPPTRGVFHGWWRVISTR